MLRRRILASAMASVMAIGSVAVVASAEETTAATTQAKTKADLEAYVKSFDKFRDDDINDYGSLSGEKFLDAIEYAENVLDEDGSTVDDYTVAYAMLEATYNKLKIYTAQELKSLLDANKKNYDQGNVYNEELGDPVFEETGYATFEEAYADAESVLGSSDSRIITDAYEALDAAANNLSRYAVVTKAQFRTALKEYEAMLQKEFKYESWRVGTLGTDWVDLKSVGTETGYWGYSGQNVAFGALYAHFAGAKDAINAAYEQMDEIKSLKQTSLTDIVKGYYAAVNSVSVMNAWTADDTNRASKANVQKLLNEYHSRLVFDYATSDANELFDAAKEITEGDLKVLITINDGQATKWVDLSKADDKAEFDAYVADNGSAWNGTVAKYTADPDGDGTGIDYWKLAEAGLNIKAGTQFYIPLDDDGKYWRKNGDDFEALSTNKPNGKYKLITKNVNVDLADYIKVDSTMLDHDTDNADKNNVLDGDVVDRGGWYEHTERIGKWGVVQHSMQVSHDAAKLDGWSDVAAADIVRTDLLDAMQLAEIYLSNDKEAIANSAIYALDTTDSIAEGTAKGSSAEWTLVYRYLRYALHDKYDTSYDLYTKADVEKLIEDCYELAEKTGDAALFSVNHNRLVDARQAALDWVKSANKDKRYKDNVSAPEMNGAYLTSTDVYVFLKNFYTDLNNDYEAFKYSFEEVYNKISDAKAAIDEGDLEATDTLLAALEDVSYKLSVVKSFDEEFGLENDAFTTDRYFQGFNRVFTKGDEYKLAISTTDAGERVYVTIAKPSDNAVSKSYDDVKVAYEALVAEIEKQTNPEVKLGDVNKDGVVNALDASAILKAVVDNTVIDVKVGDYNADGAVNALDASAILKFVVGLA